MIEFIGRREESGKGIYYGLRLVESNELLYCKYKEFALE